MRYFGRKGDAELVPMYPALNYGSSVGLPPSLKIAHDNAMRERAQAKKIADISPQAAAVGLGVILAVGALNTFVVAPLIIKAFKPDFSYGRRVGISLGISAGVAMVRGLIRAAKKD